MCSRSLDITNTQQIVLVRTTLSFLQIWLYFLIPLIQNLKVKKLFLTLFCDLDNNCVINDRQWQGNEGMSSPQRCPFFSGWWKYWVWRLHHRARQKNTWLICFILTRMGLQLRVLVWLTKHYRSPVSGLLDFLFQLSLTAFLSVKI